MSRIGGATGGGTMVAISPVIATLAGIVVEVATSVSLLRDVFIFHARNE
jgi:hypothetical protein